MNKATRTNFLAGLVLPLFLTGCRPTDQVASKTLPQQADREPTKTDAKKTDAKKTVSRKTDLQWDDALREIQAASNHADPEDLADQDWRSLKDLGDQVVGDSARRQVWLPMVSYLSSIMPRDDDNEEAGLTVEFIEVNYFRDLKGWFDQLPPSALQLMDEDESANPPQGAGWVINIQFVTKHADDPPISGELPIAASEFLQQVQKNRLGGTGIARELSHATVVKTETLDEVTKPLVQIVWQPGA